MIINHNLPAMNTYNKLTANNANTSKALEKLSSGLRINRAGDDAAGLAISEKMRGQIRGLDQAKSNSQDGISLIQTAEGNLSETQSILQRMKELATQAANDTNVGVDRGEIQKEINQLTSEINRIGNTTEFNTQKLLQGDGKSNLTTSGFITDGNLSGGNTVYTNAKQSVTFGLMASTDTNKTATWTINGKELNIEFKYDSAAATASITASAVSGNKIVLTHNLSTAASTGAAVRDALNTLIKSDADLAGKFLASNAVGGVKIDAVAGQAAQGKDGSFSTFKTSAAFNVATTGGTASVGATTYTQAAKTFNFSTITSDATLKELVGKGMTINGKQVEFYNSDEGAYTGNGIGVSISAALSAAVAANKDDVLAATFVKSVDGNIEGVKITSATNAITVTDATYQGIDGNGKIGVTDGGVQKNYEATFQVGANTAQSMTIEISDMRSQALKVSGKDASGTITAKNGTVATLKSTMEVTNGTNNTNVEYALDVSDHDKATAAISVLSDAIETVSAERSKLGAYQNRLEHTITNLTTSSENLSAAESRIRDVDMAKEMMNFQKNNILSQAAQAMLAQANQQPQNVLQLLR